MSIIKTWNRNFKTTILFHSLTKQQFKFCKEINNISKNVCAKKTWFLLKKKQKLHLWIKFFTLNFNSKNRNVTHKFYIVITVTILIVWHHGWLTCFNLYVAFTNIFLHYMIINNNVNEKLVCTISQWICNRKCIFRNFFSDRHWIFI